MDLSFQSGSLLPSLAQRDTIRHVSSSQARVRTSGNGARSAEKRKTETTVWASNFCAGRDLIHREQPASSSRHQLSTVTHTVEKTSNASGVPSGSKLNSQTGGCGDRPATETDAAISTTPGVSLSPPPSLPPLPQLLSTFLQAFHRFFYLPPLPLSFSLSSLPGVFFIATGEIVSHEIDPFLYRENSILPLFWNEQIRTKNFPRNFIYTYVCDVT